MFVEFVSLYQEVALEEGRQSSKLGSTTRIQRGPSRGDGTGPNLPFETKLTGLA